MSTVYEEMHGLKPKIEKAKSQMVLQKYAKNEGRKETSSSEYFKMLWEAFAWAAILGFHYDKRKPLKGETDSHFKYSTILSNGSDIYYSLVLFSIAKEGYKILEDSNRLNKVIEEYANGGFEIIFTILKEKGNDYFGYDKNFLEEVITRSVSTKTEKEAQVSKTPESSASDGTQFEI